MDNLRRAYTTTMLLATILYDGYGQKESFSSYEVAAKKRQR
jgi:hypothetical protein